MDDDKLGSHADGGDDQVEGDIDRDPNISATKTVHSHSDFLVAYSCPEGRAYAMFLQCYFGICQKKNILWKTYVSYLYSTLLNHILQSFWILLNLGPP